MVINGQSLGWYDVTKYQFIKEPDIKTRLFLLTNLANVFYITYYWAKGALLSTKLIILDFWLINERKDGHREVSVKQISIKQQNIIYSPVQELIALTFTELLEPREAPIKVIFISSLRQGGRCFGGG